MFCTTPTYGALIVVLRPVRSLLGYSWRLSRFASQMIMSTASLAVHVVLTYRCLSHWFGSGNPVTMPVLFYFAYKVGAFVMHVPPQAFH